MNFLKWSFSSSLAILFFTSCTAGKEAKEEMSSISLRQLVELEKQAGGKLGVYAIDQESGAVISFRGTERFPLSSTVKVIAAGALLKEADSESSLLPTRVHYTQEDLDKGSYGPITSQSMEEGLTFSQLGSAALSYNDSVAFNLIVKKLGGLEKLNEFARNIGDKSFRSDRWEPDLNVILSEDNERDTITPRDMAQDLENLILGTVLSSDSRDLLIKWLVEDIESGRRIRAGVPGNWRVGNKTATVDPGLIADVGVIWREDGSAIVLAVYYMKEMGGGSVDDEIIADATRIVVKGFEKK